jgi:peptide chain release factor subunit 3
MKKKEIKEKLLKLVELGLKQKKKHFIILDALGHKCFVPNMIGGAAQADIAILVINSLFITILLL